jgi:hypothetical protein
MGKENPWREGKQDILSIRIRLNLDVGELSGANFGASIWLPLFDDLTEYSDTISLEIRHRGTHDFLLSGTRVCRK